MSRSIICDFCGRHKWDSFVSEDWLHHYDSGKDECPACQEKHNKASMEAMFAKFRADLGIPPKPEASAAGVSPSDA